MSHRFLDASIVGTLSHVPILRPVEAVEHRQDKKDEPEQKAKDSSCLSVPAEVAKVAAAPEDGIGDRAADPEKHRDNLEGKGNGFVVNTRDI